MKSRFFKGESIESLIDTIAESTRPLDGSVFNKNALVQQITENLN